MRPLLAVLLLLAACSARALPEDCVELPGVGCWYAPPNAGAQPPLLVYLRGHHPVHRGGVPLDKALESARQAFDFYDLGATAVREGVAVLVTYRSGLGVTEEMLDALEKQAERTFPRRIAAAHSGAYIGLGETLDAGTSFERVILLDSFYSGDPELAQQVQALFPAPGSCRGYYTPHTFERADGTVYDNKRNFQTHFAPHAPSCAIEELAEGRHEEGVNDCLGRYLEGAPCR